MYVTRPLSYYKKNPDAMSEQPRGPNSGYLVVQDVESETYCCFGLCKNTYLEQLPFPQNKNLTVEYTTSTGENTTTSHYPLSLIPVINQPLSSNRYYALKIYGSHKGEAYTCSREEDKVNCFFCRCVKDVKSRPLDPNDIYQQQQILPYEGCCASKGMFYGKSVAPEGYPPSFLRTKGWRIFTRTPKNYELGDAQGINEALRSRVPEFCVQPSIRSSQAVVVGKWYCPFMFVKEGSLRDQVKRSMFYEMTLERKWERIFASENDFSSGNSMFVDVPVRKEAVFVAGGEALWNDKNATDGVIWFTRNGSGSVGLRVEIIERMKWEEERVGWVGGGGKPEGRVERVEEFGGIGGWRLFGCYVLVESFVLKRMDGSLVLSYDFRHTDQIQSRWE